MNPEPLIDIDRLFDEKPHFKWVRPLAQVFTKLLGFRRVNCEYESLRPQFQGEGYQKQPFLEFLIHLRVTYELSEEDFEKIPDSGPLFVVANHPFGVIDGLVLGAVLGQRRPDFKLLANELLKRVEPIASFVLGLDVFGGEGSKLKNGRSLKRGMQWLQNGGCLATFPSGVVSHYSWRDRQIVDPIWNAHVAGMAKKVGAKVLPIYFEGRNSLLFQIAGMIHPALRTILLAHEMIRARGKKVSVRIGNPIAATRLNEFQSNEELTKFIRLKTYLLKERKSDNEPANVIQFPMRRKAVDRLEKIVGETDASLLKMDIENLAVDALLLRKGSMEVYLCASFEIPHVLREIGRLREITFRAIGEGSGKEIDLDSYDDYYRHLFLWDNNAGMLVGSYRLGRTDLILSKRGKDGLYTESLFKFRDELVEALNPGIELGRSFVRLEYQRKRDTLLLMWKGVGEFIRRHPRYYRLFGPVSIANDYSRISKDLMVQFLKSKLSHPTFSKWVQARKPHKVKSLASEVSETLKSDEVNVKDVSALISEIESDQKGIPILLKHYLRMNGVLLSFNRDSEFSDVVDGLILVDLLEADPQVLKRHIGEEAVEALLEYHRR